MDTKSTLFGWALLLVLQGLVCSAVDVRITPERAILPAGGTLRVLCKSASAYNYCRFTVPGVGGLNLNPAMKPHNGIKYFGAGLEQGECGVEISPIQELHNGNIMCTMGISSSILEGQGTMRLTVAKAPPAPILNTTQGTHEGGSFLEGETVKATCKVANARPVANISWFIDDEHVTYGLSKLEYEQGENDQMSVSQSLTHRVRYTDNGKHLKCVAYHMAQNINTINQTLSKLNVRFPPKPPSREIERFGFTIGMPGEIVVQVYANPQPNFTWEVGSELLTEGAMDTTRRLLAQSNYRGHGLYDASLKLTRVGSEEVDRRYILWAQNALGKERYLVAISTNPAPPPEMTAGAIAGIVIAGLLIVLLVFMLIFARATGRWCFAGGATPRHNAESSDTESADHGSTHDKSSVSKLTEPASKKSRFGFLDLMKKSKNRMDVDEEAKPEDVKETNSAGVATGGRDGVVYAELDIVRSAAEAAAGRTQMQDPDKTEYAEIIHPVQPLSKKEELRKSRENLADMDTVTTTPDGKKEAAV